MGIMPLSWKKAKKFGQIPQLLSDLKSKRNRSSLNLETGFPTSLADFVVKNRDRLRKSSKKPTGKYSPPVSSLDVDETSAIRPFNSSPSRMVVETSVSVMSPGESNLEELVCFPPPSPPRTRYGRVNLASSSQECGNTEGQERQLLRRLPPFKEASRSSPKTSSLGNRRIEMNGPGKLHTGDEKVLTPPCSEERRKPDHRSSEGCLVEGADRSRANQAYSPMENQVERRLQRSKPMRRFVLSVEEVSTSHAPKDRLALLCESVSCSGADSEAPALACKRKFSMGSVVFLVFVLALGTRHIALGVTVSVAMLLLLQFAGTHLAFCSKPGQNANRRLASKCSEFEFSGHKGALAKGSSQGQREVISVLRNQRVPLVEEILAESDAGSGFESDSKIESIIVEMEDSSNRKKVSSDSQKFDCTDWKREMDLVCVEGLTVQKEDSCALKRKPWKKFVMKKFSGAKGRKVSPEQEGSPISETQISDCAGEEMAEKEELDEREHEDCIVLESADVKNGSGSQASSNLLYLVPFVLALVGLVGGRMMALVLTVCCGLLVKSAETLWCKLTSHNRR